MKLAGETLGWLAAGELITVPVPHIGSVIGSDMADTKNEPFLLEKFSGSTILMETK